MRQISGERGAGRQAQSQPVAPSTERRTEQNSVTQSVSIDIERSFEWWRGDSSAELMIDEREEETEP